MAAGGLFLGLDQANEENGEGDDYNSCCGESLPVHGVRSLEVYRLGRR